MIRRRVCQVPTCEERATAVLIRHDARYAVCDDHAAQMFDEICSHHEEVHADDVALGRCEEDG